MVYYPHGRARRPPQFPAVRRAELGFEPEHRRIFSPQIQDSADAEKVWVEPGGKGHFQLVHWGVAWGASGGKV